MKIETKVKIAVEGPDYPYYEDATLTFDEIDHSPDEIDVTIKHMHKDIAKLIISQKELTKILSVLNT